MQAQAQQSDRGPQALPQASLEWGEVRDWDAAAALIASSWNENREAGLEYSPALLQSLLACPGHLPALAPGVFCAGRLVAFVAAFPRTVRLHGKVRQFALMTLFTTAPEWKGRGLGRAVWRECLRQAEVAGYDGAIHYCVEGNISNRITVEAAATAGYCPRHVATVPYEMRLVQAGGKALESAGAALDSDAAGALVRLSRLIDAPAARVWTAEEAQWQVQRDGAVVAIRRDQGREGMLTGYIAAVSGKTPTRCLFVEDVLWGDLEAPERVTLVQRFLAAASGRADFAVLPLLGYADTAPFSASRFRRSPRLLHLYVTGWRSEWNWPSSATYIDVL